MEKRIELEKRGRAPETILDLNLDNCNSKCIVGLGDEFANLDTLSLINVGLTSLQGFPKLPNLKKLELRNNLISGELNLLHTSPKLTHLNLSGNKISDLDTLEPLKDLQYLQTLNLLNNETSIENYREKVLSLIPSLKYLDGFDVDDQEIEDDRVIENHDEGLEDKEEEQLNLNEEEVGVTLVFKKNLADESEGDVNEGGGVDDEDGEDEDAEVAQRGKKRKHEDEEGKGNQKAKLA